MKMAEGDTFNDITLKNYLDEDVTEEQISKIN